MPTWTVDWHNTPDTLKNAILIVGLPGIGNVAKVAVDFLIDGLNAQHIASFFSYSLPHSVFVNEDNLVEAPKIGLWRVPGKKRDLVLLGGDVQPMSEESCYSFCETLYDVLLPRGCTEVLTLGGVGLRSEPTDPHVYITGNDAKHIERIVKKTGVDPKLYGIVGPIIGVSGVLIGMGSRRQLPCASLLVETLGHPMYLGVHGGKKILTRLSKYLSLKLNLKELDKDLNDLQEDLKLQSDDGQPQRIDLVSKLKGKLSRDMNYIG